MCSYSDTGTTSIIGDGGLDPVVTEDSEIARKKRDIKANCTISIGK